MRRIFLAQFLLPLCVLALSEQEVLDKIAAQITTDMGTECHAPIIGEERLGTGCIFSISSNDLGNVRSLFVRTDF